jgi:hypothetical protein
MVSTMFLFPLNNTGQCRAHHDTDSSNFLPKSNFTENDACHATFYSVTRTIVLKFKKDQSTITIVIA